MKRCLKWLVVGWSGIFFIIAAKFGVCIINTQDKEDLIADVAVTAVHYMDTFQGFNLFSTLDAIIVQLKAVEGFLYSEIAEQLNISTKLVRFRYKTAMEVLRNMLQA